MDWTGLGLVVLFYMIILFIGIWIARRKGVLKSDSWDEMVLANRQLSLGVGIFTLIATEVGGAFVNGTAEEVYKKYDLIRYLFCFVNKQLTIKLFFSVEFYGVLHLCVMH